MARGPVQGDTHHVTARAAYGRLLAILAARDGNIEAAEDSLADAFLQALESWPTSGVPRNPEAWLLTVARNRQRDARRSAAHRLSDPLDDDSQNSALSIMEDIDPDDIPDRRLALLFVCAHPAIDPVARTPLMLRTVLGFDAAHIARAISLTTDVRARRYLESRLAVHARV